MTFWKVRKEIHEPWHPTYIVQHYVRIDESPCQRIKKAFLKSLIGLSKNEVLKKLLENEEYGFEQIWVYTSGKNIPKEIEVYRSHGCGLCIEFDKTTRRVCTVI